MGMVVRTNVMAMNANRQLGMNNSAVSKSLEKLSSGFRINRAADDASGLAISEKMKAQIKGLEQASSNSQDGISLIQTAEGATTEIHNMLNRMVELATKSANGTIQNEVDREAIQREVDDLSTEITRIAKSTNFNGINLLDGSLGGATVKNNAVPPAGGTTPPPVTTTVASMGDAQTPASFSVEVSDDVLKNGGKLVIGDQTFNITGDLAAGQAAGEHTVNIAGMTKDKALEALATSITSAFSAQGGTTLGGQNFSAKVEGGKLVMTAADVGALTGADGKTAMTEAELTGSITAVAGTSEPPAEKGAVSVTGTTTAGNAAKAAEKAVYDLTLNGKNEAHDAWAEGETVEVNGKTYKFVAGTTADNTNNDGTTGKEYQVAMNSKTSVADLLAQLKAEVETVEKDYDVTVNSGTGLTFTAKVAGAIKDTNAGDGSAAPKAAIAGAEPTTAGADAVTATKGSVSFAVDASKIKDGDQITINGKNFTVALGAKSGNTGETNKIDLTGIKGETATNEELANALKDAVAAELTTYDVAVGADKASITLTQQTAADATTSELETLVSIPAEAQVIGLADPAAAPAAPATGSSSAAAPTSTISFSSQPNAGSTMTIGEGANAKTFEFVKKGDQAKTTGAIAVEIGDTLGDTMDKLETAFKDNTVTDVGIKRGVAADGVTKTNEFVVTNNKTGASSNDFASVELKGMGLKLQVGDTNDDFNHVSVSVDDLTAEGLGLSGLDVSNQDAAGNSIDTIKAAINKVSTNRANLGSLQNRLEYTINNLDTTAENMTSANSRIRDTDMAKEMMNYTKMNVLTQAAQAMLAQANQQPQSILQLLQ